MSQETSRKWMPLTIGLILVLLISGMSLATGGGGASSVQLGQWNNMQPLIGSNGCVSTVVNPCNPNDPEFMNSTYFRGKFFAINAGAYVRLEVGCVAPAAMGVGLYWQWANSTEDIATNTTNWQQLSGQNEVYIDGMMHGSINFPCKGNDITAFNGAQISPQGNMIMFRVVADGANITGSSPIFSFIRLQIDQSLTPVAIATVLSIGTTSFTERSITVRNVLSSITTRFQWIANNRTSTSCALPTDTCTQSGTSSCVIAIGTNNCSVVVTYPVAFGSTPNVIVSPYLIGVTQNAVEAILPLYMADPKLA